MILELNKKLIVRRVIPVSIIAFAVVLYAITEFASALRLGTTPLVLGGWVGALQALAICIFVYCKSRRKYYLKVESNVLSIDGLFITSRVNLNVIKKYDYLISKLTNDLLGLMLVTANGGKTIISKEMFLREQDFQHFLDKVFGALQIECMSENRVEQKINIPYISFGLSVVYLALYVLLQYLWRDKLEEALYVGATVKDFVSLGEFYRPVSASFLHSGWPHLILNVACLMMLGEIMESTLRKTEFLTIFLLSAVLSIAVSSMIFKYDAILGASGGIFGLFGAYLCIRQWVPKKIPVRFEIPRKSMLLIAAIEVASGFFLENVGTGCHAFGFLIGYLFTLLLVVFADRNGSLRTQRTRLVEAAIPSIVCIYGVGIFLAKVVRF